MTRGLVIGSFRPYHEGHAFLIRTARAQVDELTVLVCTLETDRIPGGIRYEWVRTAHPDCRVVWVNEEVPQRPEDAPGFWTIWTDLVRRHAGALDVVFTSERYGDELARHLGARHVCVDLERRAVPVSGTAIREDPIGNWSYLPAHVRPYFVKRAAFVGGESTGKTTLCTRLAREFETTWVPEYGRLYCEEGRPAMALELVDFEAIAWGQATWEDEAAKTANRVLLCDTDLHVTATWSDIVVGERPPWLDAAARARHYDVVLLMHHDIPYRQDEVRVLAERRAEHTQRIRAELEAAGRPVVEISGGFGERAASAAAAIRDLLTAKGSRFG